LPLLVKSGNWNAVQVLQDTHILHSTGFTLLEHLHFDESCRISLLFLRIGAWRGFGTAPARILHEWPISG
jgi:hypothetical protein